jgi:phosphatidate cytidylyltransferase
VFHDPAKTTLVVLFAVLSILAILRKVTPIRFPPGSYTRYLWTFFLVFLVSEAVSFRVGIWLLALLCFVALKEYLTLVDIRLQDRWAIVGAHLSIPFMIYFIQDEWYGMFIISIPVYAFLMIMFLVALGGRDASGTVFSIGAITFGMFLFVYCIGHIGYLCLFSTWKAAAVILTVAVFDIASFLIGRGEPPTWKRAGLRYLAALPFAVALMWVLSGWTGIPREHAVVLGLIIPALAAVGRHTITFIEEDLGVEKQRLVPGKGQILENLKSFLYVSPVAFHYIRYFVES